MEETSTPGKYTTFVLDDIKYKTLLTTKFNNRKAYEPIDPKKVFALVPGVIQKIHVKKRQKVHFGDKLLVLEAMKMYNEILAPCDGTIEEIAVTEKVRVTKNQLLVRFK